MYIFKNFEVGMLLAFWLRENFIVEPIYSIISSLNHNSVRLQYTCIALCNVCRYSSLSSSHLEGLGIFPENCIYFALFYFVFMKLFFFTLIIWVFYSGRIGRFGIISVRLNDLFLSVSVAPFHQRWHVNRIAPFWIFDIFKYCNFLW